MSLRAGAMPSFPTARRSACNRCREQKVKCPPRQNSEDACGRCSQAKVSCFTGYLKPGIRGSRRTANLESQHPGLTRLQGQGNLPTSAARMAPGSGNLSPLTHPQLPVSPQSVAHARDDWPGPLDAILLNHGIGDVDMSSFMGYGAVESSLTPSSPSPLLAHNSVDHGFANQLSTLVSGDTSIDTSHSNVHDLQHHTQLSRLNLFLSRHLELCHTRWGSWNTVMTGIDGSDHHGDMTPTTSLCAGLLLKHSEFIDIVQSMLGGQASRLSTGGQTSGRNTNMATGLSIIQAYAMLVTNYDAILAILSEELATKSPELAVQDHPRPLPGLHLTGFPVQCGRLQAKILTQTILHQFETIEQPLGLPPEFRVSEHRRGTVLSGLLGGPQALGLLNIVMSSAARDFADQPNAYRPVDPQSLRERIKKVESLLDLNEEVDWQVLCK